MTTTMRLADDALAVGERTASVREDARQFVVDTLVANGGDMLPDDLSAGASLQVASMTGDSRIVSDRERESLLDRRAVIHPALVGHLEEEAIDACRTTRERLRHAGVHLAWT